MQGPVFLADNPIRNQRIEAVECRCDHVQFGVYVGVQESVGLVDGLVSGPFLVVFADGDSLEGVTAPRPFSGKGFDCRR
jgi:hypothetical protein